MADDSHAGFVGEKRSWFLWRILRRIGPRRYITALPGKSVRRRIRRLCVRQARKEVVEWLRHVLPPIFFSLTPRAGDRGGFY